MKDLDAKARRARLREHLDEPCACSFREEVRDLLTALDAAEARATTAMIDHTAMVTAFNEADAHVKRLLVARDDLARQCRAVEARVAQAERERDNVDRV